MAATRSKTYVLRPDALETLAGNSDPTLRNPRAGGAPNLKAIGLAAGLDAVTLVQIKNGTIGVSSWVMAALVEFLMRRGHSANGAHAELFDLVDSEQEPIGAAV